jgi:hypothetical protein
VFEVILVFRELRGKKEGMVILEYGVLMAKKESKVILVSREWTESKVILECKVLLACKVCLVILEREVRRVIAVFQGKLVCKA